MMTRTRLVPLLALAAAAGLAMTPSARAGDVTWDNGANNLVWDTASLNWGGLAWNSAAGDGAIFGAAGIGAIETVEDVWRVGGVDARTVVDDAELGLAAWQRPQEDVDGGAVAGVRPRVRQQVADNLAEPVLVARDDHGRGDI